MCKFEEKAIKTHFHNITQNGVVENKDFWNTVKPFITNKSGKLKSDITIIHNEEIIRDEQKLVEIFNNEYINIVEKSSGIKPEPLGKIISEIENKYKNDASIIKIKNRIITDESQISFNTPLYGLSSVPLITMIEQKKFQKFRASL